MHYSDQPVALWPSVYSEQSVFMANFVTTICCLALSFATALSAVFLGRSSTNSRKLAAWQGASALFTSIALFTVATTVFASKAYDVDVGGREICAVSIGSQRTADMALILQVVGCLLSFFSFAASLSLSTFECVRIERWIYGYSRWDAHDYPKLDSDHYDPTIAHQQALALQQNGETPELLRHAKDCQTRWEAAKSQIWEFHDSLCNENCSGDLYALVVFAGGFLPKALLVWPIIFLASLPLTLTAALYAKLLRKPIARVEPRRFAFRAFVRPALLLLAAPVCAIVGANLLVDFAIFSFFGSLYVVLAQRWAKRDASLHALSPYRGGPSVFTHLTDTLVATVGLVHRVGPVTAARMLASTMVGAPWVKYWLIGNSYCFDLDERYTTRASEAMSELEPMQIATAYARLVTRPSVAPAPTVKACVVPHFPEPPIGRRYAIGVEPISMFAALCHVSHLDAAAVSDAATFVMSKTSVPVFRTVYWYDNPFFPSTGFSETYVDEKQRVLQVPMWEVCGHNWLGWLSDGVRPEWDAVGVALRVRGAWSSETSSRDLFAELNGAIPGRDLV